MKDFPPCPICAGAEWQPAYSGAARDGAAGRSRDASVRKCAGCGVERLAESACLQPEAYASHDYRRHLQQGHDIELHFASHDPLARFTLETIWPASLRGKIVADVGCGGGSLLDHIRGLPAGLLAIDPDPGFGPSLRKRGYCWYPGAAEAAREFAGRVDVAFAIQVIEHVSDPRAFLGEIRALLAPDGLLVLSTPNRDDILMELLPNDFPAFFYRTQHRWYFTAETLSRCAAAAGLRVRQVRHVHRYGMANALLWLRDRKPAGRDPLTVIDGTADGLWRTWLETTGRADSLYMMLERSTKSGADV